MLIVENQPRYRFECDAKGCWRASDRMLSEDMAVTTSNALGWRKDPETGKTYCPDDIIRAEACGHPLVKLEVGNGDGRA